MKDSPKKIYFVHEGKAAYPEIAAYRQFFEGVYASEVVRPWQLAEKNDLGASVCWMMMGFYARRPKAAVVIHDYRSLSVGRCWRLKNIIKRHVNAKPDIRIFQNEEIKTVLGFNDDVPFVFLPMGVPPTVLDFRIGSDHEYDHDFCYIGAMSAERRTDSMIESFLKRFGTSRTFNLYGTPDPALVIRYQANENVNFVGHLDQDQLFAAIQKARVAVNYFPNHNPHKLQTPTKLLEYAALGMRILSNEQPQSRLAARLYGIASLWGPADDIFRDVPDELTWPDNHRLDPSAMLWPALIARSGIAEAIEKAAQK